MSYTKPLPIMITVRITTGQRKMLAEMTREWGDRANGSLSHVVRDILERERKRRKHAGLIETGSLVPPRRR